MIAGLLKSADALEFRYEVSGDSGTVNEGWHGGLISYQTTSPILPASVGVSILVDQGYMSGVYHSYLNVDFPSEHYEDLSFAGGEVKLSFKDFRLYSYEDGGWVVEYSSVDLLIDDSVIHTYAGRVLHTGIGAPSYIPLLGIPPAIGVIASTGIAPTMLLGGGISSLASATPSSFNYHSEASCVGGWRFVIGEESEEYPVNIKYTIPPESSKCSDDLPTLSEMTSTTTWNGACSSATELTYVNAFYAHTQCLCPGDRTITPAEVDWYKSTTTFKTRSEGITLIPCFQPSVSRLSTEKDNDYAAVILRGGFPWVKGGASADGRDIELTACDTPFEGGDDLPPCGVQIDGYKSPRQTSFLGLVKEAHHATEEPFDSGRYAPYECGNYEATADDYFSVVITAAVCRVLNPDEDPGEDHPCCPEGTAINKWGSKGSWYGIVEPIDDNFYIYPYLKHPTDLARAMNTYYNPHFSFCYWFPSNDDMDHWKIDFTKVNSDDYWSLIRQQHMTHGALPTDSEKGKRNFLVSGGLKDDGWGFNVASYILGVQSSYWGITRPTIQEFDLPASRTLNNESYGSFTGFDCALTDTSSTDITVQLDPGKTVGEVRFDVTQFSRKPYFQLIFAKDITPNWSDTNVGSIEVFLESVTGARTLITSTKTQTPLPSGEDTKYAGSWFNQFGDIINVDDNGYDEMETGETDSTYSSTLMSTVEGVQQFRMLPSKSGKKIVFVITPTNPVNPVVLKYPTFYFPTTPPRLIYETAQTTWIGYENGPMIRLGQWGTWNYLTDEIIYPPAPINPNGNWSMLDFLIWKRLCIYGIDGLTGEISTIDLNEELDSLMDDVESPDRTGDGLRQSAAYWTRVVPVRGKLGTDPDKKLRFLIERTYRTGVPPLNIAPVKIVNDLFKEETDADFGMQSLSIAQHHRYLISPANQEAHIWLDDTKLSALVPVDERIAGFCISKYDPIVTGEGELLSAYIRKADNKKRAVVSPWHGYTFVLGVSVKGKVHLTRFTEIGMMIATIVTDAGIDIYSFDQGVFSKRVTGIEEEGIVSAQSAVTQHGDIVTTYENSDGDTKIVYTLNLGESYTDL